MNKQLKKKIEQQEYKFRIQFRDKPDIIPETAADVLRDVAQANGGELRPGDVVDAARDEESPIHAWFEWDDSTAAEAYRVDQARDLIKSVRVIRDDRPEEPVFVHVSHGRNCHYVEAAQIVAAEDDWEAAKRTARATLAGAIACVEDLRRVAKAHGMEAEADELLRELMRGLF